MDADLSRDVMQLLRGVRAGPEPREAAQGVAAAAIRIRGRAAMRKPEGLLIKSNEILKRVYDRKRPTFPVLFDVVFFFYGTE